MCVQCVSEEMGWGSFGVLCVTRAGQSWQPGGEMGGGGGHFILPTDPLDMNMTQSDRERWGKKERGDRGQAVTERVSV